MTYDYGAIGLQLYGSNSQLAGMLFRTQKIMFNKVADFIYQFYNCNLCLKAKYATFRNISVPTIKYVV